MAELPGLRPEFHWGAHNAPKPPVPLGSHPLCAHRIKVASQLRLAAYILQGHHQNVTAVENFPGAPYGIPKGHLGGTLAILSKLALFDVVQLKVKG